MTAGPTREAIDPVRYITNHSTGKMGYAIAKTAAYRRGAEVTLVSGPVAAASRPMFVKTGAGGERQGDVRGGDGSERRAGRHHQGGGGG